jgi:hypothetical protein
MLQKATATLYNAQQRRSKEPVILPFNQSQSFDQAMTAKNVLFRDRDRDRDRDHGSCHSISHNHSIKN